MGEAAETEEAAEAASAEARHKSLPKFGRGGDLGSAGNVALRRELLPSSRVWVGQVSVVAARRERSSSAHST